MARLRGGTLARWRTCAVARLRGGELVRWHACAVARLRGGALAQELKEHLARMVLADLFLDNPKCAPAGLTHAPKRAWLVRTLTPPG